jgi:cell division septation protein DedD
VGRKTAAPQQLGAGDPAALDAAAAKEVAPSKPPTAAPRSASPAGPEAQSAGLKPQADDEGKTAAKKAVAAAPSVADDPAEEPAKPPEKAGAEKAAVEKRDSTQGRAHAATVVTAPRPATVVAAPPKPVQVASTTSVALTPPPRDVGQFTVQIGASQDRAEALRMENRARAAGLKPYAVEANLGAKGTWYRVRVGAFRDKDAASSYRRDVERELRAAAVVMPSK